MPGFRATAPILCLLVVGPGAGTLTAQACPGDRLSLAARAALRLPPNLGIEGVAARDDGSLALWAADGEILLVGPTRALAQLSLPDSIRPAGVAFDGAALRVLDEWSGREFQVSRAGTVALAGRVPLAPGDRMDQAVWLAGGWAVALRNSHSLQFTVRWRGPAGDTVLYASSPADSLRAVPRFHLTPADAGALFLTGLVSPFRVIRLDPATGQRQEFAAPLAGHQFAIASDSLHYWRALPAVALDCAVLLTLADLTSARRLLVRYGRGGRVDRVSPVDAPLGFVARVPGADVVLAARRAGDLELVWYDWRWVREPGSPSPGEETP